MLIWGGWNGWFLNSGGRYFVCQADGDGDGVPDASDRCLGTPEGEIVDPDSGCSVYQLCPCNAPRGTDRSWKNHGRYVSCVAHAASDFLEMGLIRGRQRGEIVSTAARSGCGNR